MCVCSVVLKEARRGHQTPGSWNYRWLWETLHGYWESNSRSLNSGFKPRRHLSNSPPRLQIKFYYDHLYVLGVSWHTHAYLLNKQKNILSDYCCIKYCSKMGSFQTANIYYLTSKQSLDGTSTSEFHSLQEGWLSCRLFKSHFRRSTWESMWMCLG